MSKPHWVPNNFLGTLKLQFHVVSRPLPQTFRNVLTDSQAAQS